MEMIHEIEKKLISYDIDFYNFLKNNESKFSNSDEKNPLIYAIISRKNDIAQLLIPFLDCNIQKTDGNTPLMIAIINENFNIAKLLVSKTDCNICNIHGHTALSLAKNNDKLVNLIEKKMSLHCE